MNMESKGNMSAVEAIEILRKNGLNLKDVSDGYHTFRELYEYRMLYNAMLFNEWAKTGLYNVHKSFRHHDGQSCFGGGWFVVVAELPTGQITNHYKYEHFELFQIPAHPKALVEYDNHTPADVALRMKLFLDGYAKVV